MALLFSTSPLVNKLLTIAHGFATKNGHVIEHFERERRANEDIYTASCRICHATIRIVLSRSKYERVGTAFTLPCKPG